MILCEKAGISCFFCPRYAKETDVMTKLRHFVVYIHLGDI